MNSETTRILITNFLQWNDRNGCYTDYNCDMEDISRMTYEESMKFFFIVANNNFYEKISENVYEITYEDVINYAKRNTFYGKTIQKLELLINNSNPTIDLYKDLIKTTQK